MINGAFTFTSSETVVQRGAAEVVGISPYMRNVGYAPLTAKQMTVRSYTMTAGNEAAANPGYVVTPGVRPMTACTEPWLHASGYLTTSEGGSNYDACPMYRERLVGIDIRYGDNGVCQAVATTLATTGSKQYGRYWNNVGMFPPEHVAPTPGPA